MKHPLTARTSREKVVTSKSRVRSSFLRLAGSPPKNSGKEKKQEILITKVGSQAEIQIRCPAVEKRNGDLGAEGSRRVHRKTGKQNP